MTKNKFISEIEFGELCKYVCCQVTPSGSKEIDIEVLNFAIYWQICRIFGEHVEFCNCPSETKVTAYRRNIKNILSEWLTDPFDMLQIIDQHVLEKVGGESKNPLTFDFGNLIEYTSA